MDLQLDALNEALKAVKTLRSSVGNFFVTLSQGVRSDHGEDNKETKFILELQDLISEVNSHMRRVDQTCSCLAPAPEGLYNLGNTALLAQETTQDRQALYSELVESYKWTDKLHDCSNLTVSYLQQNVMKRTYVNAAGNAKRRRYTPSSHNVPPQTVDNVIASVDRLFSDMTLTVTRPYATNAILQITLGRSLKAVVAFKGLMIEWVLVKGYNEDFVSENGHLDLWTESRYQVFRKITDNANAAMLHFYSPIHPDLAVRSFMTWFHSLMTLFTDSCRRCGNHLLLGMPPTWRDFRTLEAFHEDCKP
ncbi:mediator of RNA polymerase II transcription subunit 27 [Neocloeon triangulifer]|uniref:mediator of RNA polymerase II transcription subunit 27 n=1 Tax=Neocloeon triangulifer TaxID=2078957 RepID=UPI00286FA52D|nr:mediator of RNA polymerase II transcription subunit 27 [Neocloeon triangulifer]